MGSNLRPLLPLLSASQPKLGLVQVCSTWLSSSSPPWTRTLCSGAKEQPSPSTQPQTGSKAAEEKGSSKDEAEEMEVRTASEDESDEEGAYVNKATGEVGGPRGPEPTRYGDWERKGRCSDF